jgi:hypothetical protein
LKKEKQNPTLQTRNRKANDFIFFFSLQTVPSPKALIGATSNNRKITVLINGSSCGGRPAWVPRKYCISQFYRVCASSVKGGRGGNGVLGFGSKKCQKFTIANGPY